MYQKFSWTSAGRLYEEILHVLALASPRTLSRTRTKITTIDTIDHRGGKEEEEEEIDSEHITMMTGTTIEGEELAEAEEVGV